MQRLFGSVTKRKLITSIAALMLTLLLLWLLFRQVDFSQVARSFFSLPLWAIVLSFVLYVLVYIFRTWRTQVLLVGNRRARFHPIFAVTCLHNFFNSLLPARIGELSYVYFLRKTNTASVGDGISTLLFSRIMDTLVIAFYFVVVSILSPDTPGIMKNAIPYVGVFFGIVFVIGIAAIAARSHVQRFLGKLRPHPFVQRWNVLRTAFEKMVESLESIRSFSSWRVLLLAFCFSLLIWIAQYAISFVVLQGMGVSLSFSLVILGSGLIALTSIIPVQGVAGFGTTEGAWTVAFLAYGFDPVTSIISGFVLHIVQILFFILLGGYGVLWLFLTRRAQET